MAEETKQPWYVSTSGNGLSATVGGLSLVGLAGSIAMVAQLFGQDVSQDIVLQSLQTLVAAAGILYTVFGVARKAIFWIASNWGKAKK